MKPKHRRSVGIAHTSALKALAFLTVLGLIGCAGSEGPSGSTMTITDCMDPASADSRDIRRNLAAMRGTSLCYRRQEVREGPFHWVFHILEHRKATDGPFWVLPHDNEDTAFDAALYAVVTYGGGLLAVDSSGQRRFRGQDPNRNFSSSASESRRCVNQNAPAPGYTAAILAHYQGRRSPYLAMHNNYNGSEATGGRGTISLYGVRSGVHGFPSSAASGPLRDEDNLVVIAGLGPPGSDPVARGQIAALNAAGLNVLYKQVTERNFDCSLSDYLARHRRGPYYNIEAEHGQRGAQIDMVDRLMKMLNVKPLRRAAANPFLN